jgi:hypothetical protein
LVSLVLNKGSADYDKKDHNGRFDHCFMLWFGGL